MFLKGKKCPWVKVGSEFMGENNKRTAGNTLN